MRVESTHFIDTSILVSLVFKDPDEKECLRYLRRIPKIYKGKNKSFSLLGELYLSLLGGFTDNIKRTGAFQEITANFRSIIRYKFETSN